MHKFHAFRLDVRLSHFQMLLSVELTNEPLSLDSMFQNQRPHTYAGPLNRSSPAVTASTLPNSSDKPTRSKSEQTFIDYFRLICSKSYFFTLEQLKYTLI